MARKGEQSGEDILKEILKNSKNPKVLEQAQTGLDEAKQAREEHKSYIASQMKGSLSSTIAKSTGPLNESTKDSDNIKEILKESKEQNTNLKNLIKLNQKSVEDNSELFGRLEKTMNAIVDALQEQKRQQSQTTTTSPSKVSVPSVSPAVPPPSGGGGPGLLDLIPDIPGKNKTPAGAVNPKEGGVKRFLKGTVRTGLGMGAGGLLGGAAYGMMSDEQQEKAKKLLGENADTVMTAGGAAAGGVLSNLGTAGRVLSTVASGPMLLPAAVGAGVIGLAAHRAAAQKADPAGAENFDRKIASGAQRAEVIQGPEADKNAPNANADISRKKVSPAQFLVNEGIIKLPSEAPSVIESSKGQIVTLKDGRYFNTQEQILRNPEEKPKVEPTVSDKEALEKKMNEPQDTFSKGSSKEAIEKRMNEPQDTFSIGAVNYAKQKFDEVVPEFNRGSSGSLEAQNLPENVMKMSKEKGISYNEANKILRGEVESKDPNAFMMATNTISSKSNMDLTSTSRDEDYSSAVETPTYDAMGNYSGPDIKTEYEKAGKRIERKSSEGIVSNKSTFGSEFLGGLLSKQGLQTGSFMGNTMKEKQGTNVEGVEDENSLDIGQIFGIKKAGGIFSSDEYEVHSGKDSLKVSKSEYMRMQEYVANGEPERSLALFNELNQKNKKDIAAGSVQKETPVYDAMGNFTGINEPMIDTKDINPIESAGPNGEKLSKLEQSGQAQNQAPIVLKGGDTVNNVVTNNNTSSGGSGGGAGSPSRIGSPFDRFTIGNLWTPSP